MLCEEGMTVLKFFLHIDKDEQRKRLQDRFDDPTKRWKFSIHDLPERVFWSKYMKAYEDALEKTSHRMGSLVCGAANHSWFRDVIVSTVIVRTLQEMDMHYPPDAKLPKSMTVK